MTSVEQTYQTTCVVQKSVELTRLGNDLWNENAQMMDIPDELRCLFSASIDQQDDSYRIHVPQDELEHGSVRLDKTYRVALLQTTTQADETDARQRRRSQTTSTSDLVDGETQTPPVEEGETREVTIETTGDQGDGIVKVERGYVVIVPGARPDDQVTIEIENVRQNVAFARIVDGSSTDSKERNQTDQPDEMDLVE